MAVLAGALTACDDDDVTYVWGEPDAADCMGVYFDPDNATDFIMEPGSDCSVTLKMHRTRTDAAADVPLTLTSDIEGIGMPSTVHFDAGSADADLTLDFNSIPHKQLGSFAITIPDDYIAKYSLNYFNYESTILVSAWEDANSDGTPVTFYFTDTNYISDPYAEIESAIYQPIESEMKVLPGAGKIMIYDFLNTGVDMTFQLTASEYEDFAGYYRLSPVGNYISFNEAYESETYDDSWYWPWFVFNDAENDYTACKNYLIADGSYNELGWPFFYWYTDTDASEFCYVAPKGIEYQGEYLKFNAASMWISGTPDGTVVLPGYFYVYFRWDGETSL